MIWIFGHTGDGFDHSYIHHYPGGSDVLLLAHINIIVRRQVIQSNRGHVIESSLTGANVNAALFQELFHNGDDPIIRAVHTLPSLYEEINGRPIEKRGKKINRQRLLYVFFYADEGFLLFRNERLRRSASVISFDKLHLSPALRES